MRDAIVMWREPKMVVLSSVCASIYVAALLPFKFLVIFPGLAEVRPAAALPIVFSFLFGPAGAWGAAFGNLIGDVLGGMFGPGSIFGFIANFSYGYLPYKLWETLMGGREIDRELIKWRENLPAVFVRPWFWGAVIAGFGVLCGAGLGAAAAYLDVPVGHWLSWKSGENQFFLGLWPSLLVFSAIGGLGGASATLLAFSPLRFTGVTLIACMACAGLLGWGIDLLGFFPFRVFAVWIFANNIITSIIIAPPLLLLLHPRVRSRSLSYGDLIEPGPARPIRSRLGAVMAVAGVVMLFGAGVGLDPAQVQEALRLTTSTGVSLAFSPLVIIILIGVWLV